MRLRRNPATLRRRTGARYGAAQAAAHLGCSVPRVRALARLLGVGRVVRGRWSFSWNDVEALRRHLTAAGG
ncbi:MAG: hypothetical protein AB1505_33650 [Candidatus Latescibacterota bacterium]